MRGAGRCLALVAAGAALGLATPVGVLANIDADWGGGIDLPWNDPSHWSPQVVPNNGPPGTEFNVTILAGRPVLDGDFTISGLNVLTSGGFGIAGPGSLTVLDQFNMTGGTIGSTATLTLYGDTNLTTDTTKTFDGTINLFGNMSSQTGFNTFANLQIQLAGVLDVTGSQTFIGGGSNSGTINHNSTGGLSLSGFTNNGLVNVNAGSVNLGTNTTGNGTWNISAPATLTVVGNNVSLGGEVTGPGTLFFNGFTTSQVPADINVGTVQIFQQQPTFTGNAVVGNTIIQGSSNTTLPQFNGTYTTNTLSMQDGVRITGMGILNVNGTATISSGQILGTGQKNFNGTTNVTTVTINAAPVNIGGTLNQSGQISFLNNGTLTVTPDGIINVGGNASGTGSVVNNGLFSHSGTGTSVWNVPFSGTGDFLVTQGRLTLQNNTTIAGDVDIQAPGTFTASRLSGTIVHNFTDTSNIFGNGTFETAVGPTTNINGVFSVTGATNLSGTTTFNTQPQNLGALTVGANVNFPAGIGAVNSITHQSGTLSITGGVTVTAPYVWTAGTLTGAGTTTTNQLTISGTSAKTLNNRNMEWLGPTSWTGGQLNVASGDLNNDGVADVLFSGGSAVLNLTGTSVFTNAADGELNLKTSLTVNTSLNPSANFVNKGEVNAFASMLSRVHVDNSNLLRVHAGTTTFAGGSTNTGSIDVASGATLNYSTGTHIFGEDSSVAGEPGSLIRFTGGGLLPVVGDFNGDGTVDVISTTVAFGPGHTIGTLNVTTGVVEMSQDLSATPSSPTVQNVTLLNATLTGTGDAGADGPPIEVQSLQVAGNVTISNINLEVNNEVEVPPGSRLKLEEATLDVEHILLASQPFQQSSLVGDAGSLGFGTGFSTAAQRRMSGQWELRPRESAQGNLGGGLAVAVAILLSGVEAHSEQRLSFSSPVELDNSTIQANQLEVTESLTLTNGSSVTAEQLTIFNTDGQPFSFTGAIDLSEHEGQASIEYRDSTEPVHLRKIKFGVGKSPGATTLSGNVEFISSALNMELAGLVQGISYDHIDIAGTLTLTDSSLLLSIIDGFEAFIDAQDVFTLITTEGIIGSFANVASGGRLQVEGGPYSFEVFYGVGSPFSATDVVITGFMIPEPSGLALLLALLPALQRRRRVPLT